MKVHELLNEAGQLHAFEIPQIGRNRAVNIIALIDGVKVTRKPALFSYFRENVFCEFTLNNRNFTVEFFDPFGDSDEYLIGQNPPGTCEELKQLRQVFASATSIGYLVETALKYIILILALLALVLAPLYAKK